MLQPTSPGSLISLESRVLAGRRISLKVGLAVVSQLRAILLREVQPRAGTERLLMAATLCA